MFKKKKLERDKHKTEDKESVWVSESEKMWHKDDDFKSERVKYLLCDNKVAVGAYDGEIICTSNE